MTIGRIDINEKDLPKICGAIIQLEERADASGGTIGAGLGIGASPGGRLTLQTLTPVMTTTQSAKTTLYYTPYNGSTVPVYDGTNFSGTAFSELSALTTDTTKSPAAIGASKVNDWFVWSDSGTLRLGHGPDWTSDTARSAGTALVMVNGILLNNASITNGPAASRGIYVGTTRSNASSQLDWIVGGSGAGGVAAVLNVWNMYNRVQVGADVTDSTAAWSYTSATLRSVNASNNNRISFVTGLAEDCIDASHTAGYGNTAFSGIAQVGVGLDTTSSADRRAAVVNPAAGVIQAGSAPRKIYAPQLGFHFIQALEASDGVNLTTFAGGAAQGLSVTLRM